MMKKTVIAVLPGDQVQLIYAPADSNSAEFVSDKGDHLSLPIENFVYGGNEYHICRYSQDISDDLIIEAIFRNFPPKN
ncbi:hypothetical protein H4F39_07320 [Pectobacterium brasiliense]|uniref:hypothetical protein n=1 Tax=Pectobacterium brasiliense TaxID=180957 RepID=UPI001969CFF4|nr:hypothetical protein [Pectobacterium brasiliense]MBN3093498.1 hypothetical protein [Pectobacterium brasiliense]